MTDQLQRSEPVQRRVVFFAGRVQGVGFRHTTWHIAGRYPVRGYVQNLYDGRVQLVVEGPGDTIDQFLSDLRAEMDRHIRHVEVYNQPATGEFNEFTIRH
jgi:acylphosphatase